MRLALRGRALELMPRSPALMGIVNAGPDSWGDGVGGHVAARSGRGRSGGGGGDDQRGERPGRAGPGLAVRGRGRALVITHTRAETKAFPAYEDVVADVAALLGERAVEAGVAQDALLLDPGLDLAKTPAQSVEVLRRLPELYGMGLPLLVAVSRKDFEGAITGRPSGERDAGALAALEPALDAPGAVVRVHDVAGARDFIGVRAALRGDAPVASEPLAEDLRRETPA